MSNISLQDAISARRRDISTDSYPMSIGELTNLYREDELDVHPEFQRIYRWTDEQKSRLVESILLGIPLPSVFVAQTESGTWDVVDGVQRISTILEFQGLLIDDEGNRLPHLRLTATRYLPQLEGVTWESSGQGDSLTQAQRLDIRRAKVDLKIIKRESSSARLTLAPPGSQPFEIDIRGYYSPAGTQTSAVVGYIDQFATYDPPHGGSPRIIADASGIASRG